MPDARDVAIERLHANQRSMLDGLTDAFLEDDQTDIAVLVSATLLTASSMVAFCIESIDREHPDSHLGYDAIDEILQSLIAENRNRQSFGPMIAVVSE